MERRCAGIKHFPSLLTRYPSGHRALYTHVTRGTPSLNYTYLKTHLWFPIHRIGIKLLHTYFRNTCTCTITYASSITIILLSRAAHLIASGVVCFTARTCPISRHVQLHIRGTGINYITTYRDLPSFVFSTMFVVFVLEVHYQW